MTALGARSERPVVGSVPDNLAHSALLLDGHARHVIRGEIPNPALTHLPACRGQTLEIGELHRINETLIRAPREDLVGLVRPEIHLDNDRVGRAGWGIGRRRSQDVLLRRVRQARRPAGPAQ